MVTWNLANFTIIPVCVACDLPACGRQARFHVFIIDFQRSHRPESFRDDDKPRNIGIYPCLFNADFNRVDFIR
jgi:hypothetical protein